MSQKLVYLISFVLVLGMAGNALAVNTDWNNASGDRRWDNPLNWSTGAVPTADDKASIRNDGVGPIIDSITTAVCDNIPVGDWGFTNTLDITGGSLTTNNWFIIGYGGNDEGTFNVSGGTTTVVGSGTDLTVGRSGVGHLNISDGSIEVGDILYVGRDASGTGYITMTGGLITIIDDLYAGDNGTAHINVSGGVIEIGDRLHLGNSTGGEGHLTMTGGLITIIDDLYTQAGTAYINVSGGVLDIGERIFLGNGTGGEGHLTMTGGSITLGQLMAVGRDGASGEVHLDGGTLDIDYWLEMSSRASIDITGGTLIMTVDDEDDLNGTYRSIRPWIDDGRITAYGGLGTLIVDYNTNPGRTTLTAILKQASEPEPEHEETGVYRTVVLSWTPGEYAVPVNGHKVYFSENFNDVNDGIGGAAQDANSYALPQRLDFGTTYYWKVDEANSTTGWDEGDIWQFTTELLANPIDVNNITATASSTNQADQGPENTINGSGLDVNDMHSTLDTDMWLSGGEPNAWIEYELDKVHKLHEMWVWNSNQVMESFIGFGIKDVTIEYSTNGTDYTTLGTTHEFVQAPGAVDYAHNTTIDFSGVTAKYVRLTANSNWGGIFKQYGLSEVRFFSIPVFAREPSPDSGTTDVAVDVTLGFRAGREAAKHNVYLSTDEQAVVDGTAPVTTVTENSYSTSLDVDSTYYWRVDEVNDAETTTTWRGEIWNFTTPEYLVVDDFESYNAIDPPDPASNTIFASWEDGYTTPTTNGALIGVDTLPYTETRFAYVHSGAQAMPYSYGNNGKSSVGTLMLTGTARDFTRHGVGQLSLWFRGESTNAVEPMYVALNGIAIPHTNPNATQVDAYEEWVIPLEDFATLGVTLNNVTSIAISIGAPTTGAASEAGTMSFDDLRLYRIAP